MNNMYINRGVNNGSEKGTEKNTAASGKLIKAVYVSYATPVFANYELRGKEKDSLQPY